MIKIVFRHDDFIEPNIGDRFIIHKPENVHQRPGWGHAMDIYDNAVIRITGWYEDPSIIGKKCWSATVEYSKFSGNIKILKNMNLSGYMFNYRWLEQIDEICSDDIDDSLNIDFFNI